MSSTAPQLPPEMKAIMAAAHPLRSGGNDRAFRRICVISVASSDPPADTKC